MNNGAFNLRLSVPADEDSLAKFLYDSLQKLCYLGCHGSFFGFFAEFSFGYFCWKFRTQSGTFTDGDLLVNKDGVRIVPQNDVQAVSIFSLLIVVFGYIPAMISLCYACR